MSPNATWYQDGSVTVSHATNAAGYDSGGQPFGAPSVIFVDGGTWVQRAALTVVARTVGVSLGGDSAVWDQQAAADISVPYNGMAGDSHTGVSLAATRTTWHQRGPLTMRVSVGVGVRAGSTGMAQWNQTGDLDMTVVVGLSTGPVDGIALGVGTLGEGAVWLQSGLVQIQVTTTGIGAIGGAIALDANNNRHRWEQTGALKVTLLAQNGGLVRGVRIGQRSTTWMQAGPVSVVGSARANGTIHAIVLGSAVWSSDNVWHQSGLLSVNVAACADSAIVPTVPSAAIRGTSRCGTWRSTGVVDLTASSSLCGGASAYPLWLDSRGCNFTLEHAAVLYNGTVRCDTAPTAPSPAAIRGLPLGTPVQGALLLCTLFFFLRDERGTVVYFVGFFPMLHADRCVQRLGTLARGQHRMGRWHWARRLAAAGRGEDARLGRLCRLVAFYLVRSNVRPGQRYAVCLFR